MKDKKYKLIFLSIAILFVVGLTFYQLTDFNTENSNPDKEVPAEVSESDLPERMIEGKIVENKIAENYLLVQVQKPAVFEGETIKINVDGTTSYRKLILKIDSTGEIKDKINQAASLQNFKKDVGVLVDLQKPVADAAQEEKNNFKALEVILVASKEIKSE